MSSHRDVVVDVILPVYNAADDLRVCLDALQHRLPVWASLHLADDASTDPNVAKLLSEHPITRLSGVTVSRNASNLGFVENVNQAIRRTALDVVLLNSDTIVTHGWLDRLMHCMGSDERIASVTPFSNNAEICSIPEFCVANPVPARPEELALAVRRAGAPAYPELPTGVGFCMLIRREAWTAVGEFDAVTFGRGYGEENDWCRRAVALGWRHVLCDDAYVVHVGGKSFAETGHRPGGEQLDRLVALHPEYNATIADFIRRDPIAPRREAILSWMSNNPSPGS